MFLFKPRCALIWYNPRVFVFYESVCVCWAVWVTFFVSCTKQTVQYQEANSRSSYNRGREQLPGGTQDYTWYKLLDTGWFKGMVSYFTDCSVDTNSSPPTEHWLSSCPHPFLRKDQIFAVVREKNGIYSFVYKGLIITNYGFGWRKEREGEERFEMITDHVDVYSVEL